MIETHERALVVADVAEAPRADVASWLAHLSFGLVVATIAAVHFRILTRNGEPSGLDFGNWLTIAHHWLGTGAPNGSTSTYPPVVPLIALGAVSLFGLSLGTALVATVAALVPAAAVYVVTVNRCPKVVAIALGTVIAAAGSTGEATAWGGVPQLLGLGVGLLALRAFVELLRWRRRRAAWTCGLLLALTGAITHLILAQIVACVVAVILLRAVSSRAGRHVGPWLGRDGLLAHVARISLPLLPLVPLYLQLSNSVGASFVSRTTTHSWISTTLDAYGGIFTDAPLLWKSALVVTLLVPIVFVRFRDDPLWLLTSAILYTDVASVVLTGESRLVYLSPLGIATGIALAASHLDVAWPRPLRVLGVLCLGGVSAAAIVAGLRHFSDQRRYYGERLVQQGTTAALDWVRAHTPRAALFAVPPVDAVPFGWWVEGYGRRAALTGSLEEYLNFPRERERAQQSISLFGLTGASATTFVVQARSLGVDYVYIPTEWNGLAGTGLQSYIDKHPSSVVFRNRAAIVVSVTQ